MRTSQRLAASSRVSGPNELRLGLPAANIRFDGIKHISLHRVTAVAQVEGRDEQCCVTNFELCCQRAVVVQPTISDSRQNIFVGTCRDSLDQEVGRDGSAFDSKYLLWQDVERGTSRVHPIEVRHPVPVE